MRSFDISDEGDCYEVVLLDDGRQIGCVVVDIEPLGDDVAWSVASSLGSAFVARIACVPDRLKSHTVLPWSKIGH